MCMLPNRYLRLVAARQSDSPVRTGVSHAGQVAQQVCVATDNAQGATYNKTDQASLPEVHFKVFMAHEVDKLDLV